MLIRPLWSLSISWIAASIGSLGVACSGPGELTSVWRAADVFGCAYRDSPAAAAPLAGMRAWGGAGTATGATGWDWPACCVPLVTAGRAGAMPGFIAGFARGGGFGGGVRGCAKTGPVLSPTSHNARTTRCRFIPLPSPSEPCWLQLLFFFFGTLAPFFLALDSPMAIACFGFFTFLPALPLLSLPCLYSCMAFLTSFCDFFPYLAIDYTPLRSPSELTLREVAPLSEA